MATRTIVHISSSPKSHYVLFTYDHRVVIRGEQNEHAVLCTNDKTYEIKVAETSNSLLLCPSLILPGDNG